MKDREQKNQYSKRNFPYPKTVNAANALQAGIVYSKGTPRANVNLTPAPHFS
jgi:hypothetical protein